MRHRFSLPLLLALVAALLAGCGDRNLIVQVDVLSYLDPSVVQVSFGPVPPAPGGIATGEVIVVKDAHVNLIERPNDLAKVQSVSLTFAAQVNDSTGSGADTLRLYMSDQATDPLTTPAVATLPFVLTDGQVDTLRVDVAGDQRMIDLFNGTSVRLSATNSLRGPASGAPLNGQVNITAIRATIVAGRKGL